MTEIRIPTATDAETLGRMHHAAWREAYEALLPERFWDGFTPQIRAERWRRTLTEQEADGKAFGRSIRAAFRDGAAVGFAMAGPSRPNVTAGAPTRARELYALYVLADEYGTGLAQRLLDAVLPPDEPAELWVFAANGRAQAFYARNRFRPDGVDSVFGERFGRQREIRMVR